ncbi:MAG: hypothetical protein P1U69_00925 [Parvibaculaceae bacterium]|nr:hypothetical protein [Parvibaculaceae bacterium]HBM89078.1 hypothetical protein [Rhodobiaceae bacterium]|tara:strand:- start:741 stop:1253 length:513 start_codon:yes stop_codon:yes gene_type:complete
MEVYRDKIDRLISESSGEIVLNGSHDHAAIIVERMFSRARESVKILTRKFDPRIYCDAETVEAAQQMLGDNSRSIKILIEEIEATNPKGNPYFGELSQFGNLSIRVVPEVLREPISVNFTVMDDCGYRFEKDQSGSGATAIVAFGDVGLTERLSTLFENVWEQSKEYEFA